MRRQGDGGPRAAATAWTLMVPCRHTETELVADRLWMLGATAVAEEDHGLVAGFRDEESARDAAEELLARGRGGTLRADDGAWRSAWRSHAPDLGLGRLIIRTVERAGGGARPSPSSGTRVVEIDPRAGFGTGHHPSTRQCLRAVLGRAGPGVSVLDVGTGSGILAVAAAALGAAPVVALDNDPEAAETAMDNARANGERIQVACGTLSAIRSRFGLVVANLGGALAPVAMAPEFGAVLAPAGRLVLAGLLEHQADPVSSAFAALGPVDVEVEDGWACVSVGGPPEPQSSRSSSGTQDSPWGHSSTQVSTAKKTKTTPASR